jgi:peptidoglycan/LPS O-acetylase OafA/YrhL
MNFLQLPGSTKETRNRVTPPPAVQLVRTLPGPQSTGKHVPALDGIRGLAILAVLVAHCVPRLPDTGFGGWYNQAVGAGGFGVDLFFVLSGFLITGILLDSKGTTGYFRNFYARRFLRLFPVYYLYLAFVALLLPAIHHALHTHMPDYGGNWWWYLLYACNLKPGHGANDPYLGHFWSLAVEEHFYLVWPALVLVLSRRRLAYCCFGAITLAVVLRVSFSWYGADWNTIYRVTPMRLDALALGALGAIALRSERWSGRGPALAWKALLAGGALFLGCVLWGRSASWNSAPIQTFGAFFLATAFAGLVYLSATTHSGLARVFSTRWLRMFGRYSYTIYVIHVLITSHVFWAAAALAKRTGPWPYWANLICSGIIVATAYGIAALSWKYYENPILQLKKRFGGRPAT